MAIQSEVLPRYPCKCCGFLTLTDPAHGSYEICPVCFWEDDPVQNDDPLFVGGANAVSLDVGRDNYVRLGGCDPASVDKVRPPVIDEVPAPAMIQGLEPSRQVATLRGVKVVLLGVVRAMLSGRIKMLEGCSAVAAVGWPIDEPGLDEMLRVFSGVAGEIDELPTPAARHLWSPEALTLEDAKTADYERRIETPVRNACVRLERYLRAELSG